MTPSSNRWAGCAVVIADPLRRSLGVFVLLLAAATLTACASRPVNGFLLPVAVTAPGAAAHTLLVATTRERDPTPGTMFNGERSSTLDYAEITVSVPPNHVPGRIEWASTPPGDPAANFVVRDEAYLDGDKAFVQALNAQLAARPPGKRNVFVFIHGFNTLFAEGVYTLTQLVHDSNAPGVPVLFTWASRGRPGQYIYDTNSATAARDNLEHTLRLLLASNAEHVNLLAHSLGNWVMVETLRQMKISTDLKNANKFGLVILAAPDIDIDVFESQLRRFGQIQRPFYVVLSRDDKALWLSNTIAGGETRVGNATDIAQLSALGATVIDLTEVQSTDAANHDKFDQLALVAPELRAVLANGIHATPGAGPESELAPASSAGSGPAALINSITGAPIRIFASQ